MPTPLIIDCDPGIDDAIALLLALAHPEQFDLRGVTTVAGNVPLSMTQANARRIIQLSQRSVPVFAGCPRPLLRPLHTAEEVHGATGLEGAELPPPHLPLQAQHAVPFLIEQLEFAVAPLTVAALGPLTNLAIALIQRPHIAEHIEQLVVMGGAITRGNVTASAEFNIYVDPHAAHIVFTAGIPLTLISLDVTHQALTTPERLASIRNINTAAAQAAADLLAHYGQDEAQRNGWPGPPLHDPCVLAYLLQPSLFSGRPMGLAVETASPLTLGRTVVDPNAASPNAQVLESIHADGFYQLLCEGLSKL